MEWGLTMGLAAGTYASYKSGPFFEEPLIGGETDKPLVDETVPTTWLMSASALTSVGILAIPPSHNDLETRYLYAKGMAQAFVLNSFLTIIGKDIIGRYRPNADARIVEGYSENKLRDSFPSGHTSTSFTVASYLSLYLWEAMDRGSTPEEIGKGLVTAVLAGTAGWIGYTRIEDNAHRPGEVLTGAVLGTAVGVGTFYYQHSRVENRNIAAEISAYPMGITFTWRF